MDLPPGIAVNGAGRLTSGGLELGELARRHGTPLYVINESVVRQRCRAYRAAFAGYEPGAQVVYAAKAFLTLAMARLMDQEGLWLDVVSAGELQTALAAGFPAERVLFHGNNKSAEEIALSLEAGVGCFALDNFHELDLLAARSAARGRRTPVLVRVAPGIEAHTHHYIQTGKQDSKFGFDLATGQALEAARRVAAAPGLELVGLHAHVASQVMETEPFRLALGALLDLAAAVREATGCTVRLLNTGGGLGIRYLEEDDPPTPAALGRTLVAAVREGCARRGLPLPVLAVEPGRSIVGEAGVALYTVGASKRVPGLVPYVAMDGGMGDNVRPALYDARYRVAAVDRPLAPPEETVHVVGRYCESGDWLARDAALPALQPGDVLAFFSAGAYQIPMASNYNRVPRPCVLLVADGRAHVIVERETVAEMYARDRLPPHLTPALGVAVGGVPGAGA